MSMSAYLAINTGIEEVSIYDVGSISNLDDLWKILLGGTSLFDFNGHTSQVVLCSIDNALKNYKLILEEEHKNDAFYYLMRMGLGMIKHPNCVLRFIR